jgi:hypothetical protein
VLCRIELSTIKAALSRRGPAARFGRAALGRRSLAAPGRTSRSTTLSRRHSISAAGRRLEPPTAGTPVRGPRSDGPHIGHLPGRQEPPDFAGQAYGGHRSPDNEPGRGTPAQPCDLLRYCRCFPRALDGPMARALGGGDAGAAAHLPIKCLAGQQPEHDRSTQTCRGMIGTAEDPVQGDPRRL